jgi:hypothetical protein
MCVPPYHRCDDGGSTHLWKSNLLLRDFTAPDPRRLSSSYSPQWEPEIPEYIDSLGDEIEVQGRRHDLDVMLSFYALGKGKGKAVPHGGVWGRGGIAPIILDLGTRWWVVSITPRPRFYPGERTPSTHWTGGWVGPRAGLDTEAGGKILCPAGNRTPIARSSSP